MACRITRVLFLLIIIFILESCSIRGVETNFKTEKVVQKYKLVFRREVPSSKPSLLSLFVEKDKKGTTYQLLISSFSDTPNTKDYVQVWENVTYQLNSTGIPVYLQKDFYWPKEIVQAPDGAFSFKAITIPDGSQVVGKQEGQIVLADITNLLKQSFYSLTSKQEKVKNSYNFGRLSWFNLGGILSKDNFLVCRNTLENSNFHLVLYKRPVIGSDLSQPWTEILLREDACDANLAMIHFKKGLRTYEAVFATGKLTKEFTIFWPEDRKGNPGDWTDPSQIRRIILDKDREFYDVQIADVNKDGHQDVVVTILGGQGTKAGALEVWQVDPNNFNSLLGYTKHVIASNILPTSSNKDARSPGPVRVFYPNVKYQVPTYPETFQKEFEKNQVGKPWLLLGGGDNGKVSFFVPTNESLKNWTYSEVNMDFNVPVQSVHGVEVADVDNDGWSDVFISLYYNNLIQVYSFLPATTKI